MWLLDDPTALVLTCYAVIGLGAVWALLRSWRPWGGIW